MWFKIQKASFWKLYRYYIRKLRSSLVWTLFAIPFIVLGCWSLAQAQFEGGVASTFRTFSLHFLQPSIIVSLIFLFQGVQQLSGVSQRLFQWKQTQTQTEEIYLILFLSPSNRQTLLVAKLAALASYHFFINLIGLTFPVLFALLVGGQVSVLALLSLLIFQSLIFSLFSWFWFVPALFYFYFHYSPKNQLLYMGYLFLVLLVNSLLIMLWPLLFFPLFIVAVLVGSYFTWQYWKAFRSKDYS